MINFNINNNNTTTATTEATITKATKALSLQQQQQQQQRKQQQMQKQAAAMAQITPEMAEAVAEALAQMRKVQNKIVETCDDVGDAFAEEARKIHYGEAEDRDLSRGIYGNATEEEAEALHEEGIEIVKMPWLPKEQ